MRSTLRLAAAGLLAGLSASAASAQFRPAPPPGRIPVAPPVAAPVRPGPALPSVPGVTTPLLPGTRPLLPPVVTGQPVLQPGVAQPGAYPAGSVQTINGQTVIVNSNGTTTPAVQNPNGTYSPAQPGVFQPNVAQPAAPVVVGSSPINTPAPILIPDPASPSTTAATKDAEWALRVVDVAAGPAAKAGLQKGDVILRIDGLRVKSFDDLRTALKNSSGKSSVAYFRPSAGKRDVMEVAVEETRIGVSVEPVSVVLNDAPSSTP